MVHDTVAQRQFLFIFYIPLPPDQHHISDVANWRQGSEIWAAGKVE